MRDDTFMTLMRLLPKAALSSAVGAATRSPVPAGVHQAAMRAFTRRYGVNLAEAERGVEGYKTFAEFFTRRLKPGLRPVVAGEKIVASPVDGVVSQNGYAERGECIQAKGISFPLHRLLGSEEAAKPFIGGAYATLYLAPPDYHRIHAPLPGHIEGYAYLPGTFWPVNPISARAVPGLFALNERLITFMSTIGGPCAVVKVGATCVARIRASYDASVTHRGEPGKTHRYPTPLPIEKGGELGMFEMGSTVILLFAPGRVEWDESLVAGTRLRMGQRIGEVT